MVYCICFDCNNAIFIQLCKLISTFLHDYSMPVKILWPGLPNNTRGEGIFTVPGHIHYWSKKEFLFNLFSIFCMYFYVINHSKPPIFFFLIVFLWFYASKCCLYSTFEVKPSRKLCLYLSSIFQLILVKFCLLLPLIYFPTFLILLDSLFN